MFCGKCGANNADDATFCIQCGEKLTPDSNVPQTAQPTGAMTTENKNKLIGIISVAAVVVVVAILLIAIFAGRRSYNSTVNKYMKASMESNPKAIINLFPKKML